MNKDQIIFGHTADGTAITRAYAERNVSNWFKNCTSFTPLGQTVAEMTTDMLNSNGTISTLSDIQREAARLKAQLN